MTKRMLIDATHPEETRVVVLQQEQLTDFDFETSTKKQLKGNTYLAKVTRVEPSLQAAFVEYGGNRHGFLAFSEIHPDYYQIPQADRELLERLERDSARVQAEEDDEEDAEEAAAAGGDADAQPDGDGHEGEAADAEGPTAAAESSMSDEALAAADAMARAEARVTEDADEETAEVMGEQARVRARLLRSYKIQEVIKRRQILLVQVVKEERGNKGAALTTYISLAGRYCVLMPNTPRGGGISRKIANTVDRRRLKSITEDLEVPEGMGLIVRTAGQQRSKAEIKRDYDFLLRQWSDIRDKTLESVAPALIYAEGDLIKRAMRDLYTRDIDEVLVEGEESYKSAKRLMQMMMPSRARNVKQYKEELPLFYRYKVEDQLDAMHSPTVQLPSGGSIVIHTTEALTAIDVNSGRSTRERHIDETAVKTNLEAADEVARQLRLRDLAGLIVIDFIDMGEMRHQRQVERRFREALKIDRARLQVGKISMFGLLELSRQRLRASLQELSSQTCPTCSGLGVIRSTESCALQALRMVQEEGIKNEAATLHVTLPVDVGLYLLNNKRDLLVRLEQRYVMKVVVAVDAELHAPTIELETLERRERGDGEAAEQTSSRSDREAEQPEPQGGRGGRRGERADRGERSDRGERADRGERGERPGRSEERPPAAAAAESDEEARGRRRRRRRRRRRGEDGESVGEERQTAASEVGESEVQQSEAVVARDQESGSDLPEAGAVEPMPAEADAEAEAAVAPAVGDEEARPRARRRRRGRRGVGRSGAEAEDAEQAAASDNQAAGDPNADEPSADTSRAEESLTPAPDVVTTGGETAQEVGEDAPQVAETEPELVSVAEIKPELVPEMALTEAEPEPALVAASEAASPALAEEQAATRFDSAASQTTEPQPVESEPAPAVSGSDEDSQQPARQGWWSRWVR